MVGSWRSAVRWKQESTYCTSFSVTARRGVLSWSWLSSSPLMRSQHGAGALQRCQSRSAGSGEELMSCAAGKGTVSPSPALAHSLAAHLGHTMPLPPLHPFHPSVTAHPCWVLTCPMYWERGFLVPQQGDGWFPALKNTSGVAPCGHCCSLRMSGSCGMRC